MNTINLAWWTGVGGKNWGDMISPIIAQKISNAEIIHVPPHDTSNVFRYYSVGSIVPPASTNSEIWGSGIIQNIDKVHVKPKKIHAVRGPLTRQIFLKNDVECPDVYGDPALLLPRWYMPVIKKTHKIGIIPHYIDQGHPWVEINRNNPEVKIINILGGASHVVDEILSCENILSSTLHGIIAADAYGVPSKWIKLSNKLTGGSFKFEDYFMSVKREDIEPTVIVPTLSLNNIMSSMQKYTIDIDLDKLFEACPYKKTNDAK
jgi:pyruvyltransferase